MMEYVAAKYYIYVEKKRNKNLTNLPTWKNPVRLIFQHGESLYMYMKTVNIIFLQGRRLLMNDETGMTRVIFESKKLK